MGTRYWIGNSTRKEYIDCPYGCEIFPSDVIQQGSCIPSLLMYALYERWDDNGSIHFYHDAGAPCPPNNCNDEDHIPWWCKPKEKWTNIAPDLIDDIGSNWTPDKLTHYKDREKNRCICK